MILIPFVPISESNGSNDLGLENASGFLGLDPASTTQPGLKFTDADLGLLWLRSEADTSKGWAWGEGTVAGLSLVGGFLFLFVDASRQIYTEPPTTPVV